VESAGPGTLDADGLYAMGHQLGGKREGVGIQCEKDGLPEQWKKGQPFIVLSNRKRKKGGLL